jgi:hypothetical protein
VKARHCRRVVTSVVVLFQNDTAKDSVCVSRDCINTAYNLMKSVNTTADPCEDFYEVQPTEF